MNCRKIGADCNLLDLALTKQANPATNSAPALIPTDYPELPHFIFMRCSAARWRLALLGLARDGFR